MLLSSSRLSESPIWNLQQLAYTQLGVESWSKGRVPLQITNNARIAAQSADIVCAAFPKGDFTILELGGGCGKFAFLLISELIRRNLPKIHYLLTDAALKNVAYWKQHPRLLLWIERISTGFAHHVIIANPLWRDRLISRSVILTSPPRERDPDRTTDRGARAWARRDRARRRTTRYRPRRLAAAFERWRALAKAVGSDAAGAENPPTGPPARPASMPAA